MFPQMKIVLVFSLVVVQHLDYYLDSRLHFIDYR